jgi:hypothetical protein
LLGSSFYDFVGAGEEGGRNGDAERLSLKTRIKPQGMVTCTAILILHIVANAALDRYPKSAHACGVGGRRGCSHSCHHRVGVTRLVPRRFSPQAPAEYTNARNLGRGVEWSLHPHARSRCLEPTTCFLRRRASGPPVDCVAPQCGSCASSRSDRTRTSAH